MNVGKIVARMSWKPMLSGKSDCQMAESESKDDPAHKKIMSHPTKLSPAQATILRKPARKGRPMAAKTSWPLSMSARKRPMVDLLKP